MPNLNQLNTHLFDQLKRLEDPLLVKDSEKLKQEIQRAKAIGEISQNILSSANTTIDAMKLVANSEADIRQLPKMLGFNKNDNS